MLLRLSLISVLLTVSCSHAGPKATQSQKISGSPIATPVTTTAVSNQPIRSLDFCKVGFPNYPVYVGDRGETKYITLQHQDGCSLHPTYGDVTGDDIEEAIFVLGIENRGSAIPEIVYIFTLENSRPKLLWSFETGDRADGGYQNVYGDRGELVIELEGKNKVIGKELYGGDDTSNGLCCPTFFTRTRYRWNGSRFVQIGEPENVPIPRAEKTNGAT